MTQDIKTPTHNSMFMGLDINVTYGEVHLPEPTPEKTIPNAPVDEPVRYAVHIEHHIGKRVTRYFITRDREPHLSEADERMLISEIMQHAAESIIMVDTIFVQQ